MNINPQCIRTNQSGTGFNKRAKELTKKEK